jgi:hypothetical protein
MQYTNYEEGVVHRYSVKLVGWTFPSLESPTLISPSEMSTSLPALKELHDALRDGTCDFQTLSRDELTTRIAKHKADITAGRAVQRVRETRSDAGIKRPRAARDEEDEQDDGEPHPIEPALPPAKKRRAGKKVAGVVLTSPGGDGDAALPSRPLRRKKNGANTATATAVTNDVVFGTTLAAAATDRPRGPTKKRTTRKASALVPRNDATTQAALQRIKSRATITASDDERNDQPNVDKENEAVAPVPGSGAGHAEV